MKKTIIYSFLALLILSLAGCKKEKIDLYQGRNSIYFPEKEQIDFLSFSFGYVGLSISDTLMSIPVRTTGAVVDYDRPYTLYIDPSSTLREDQDFEILNKPLQIDAGSLEDTILIRIHRTASLRQDTLQLIMDLKPDSYFTNDLMPIKVGYGENEYLRHLNSMDLFVDDIVGAPVFWSTHPGASVIKGYLGDFSVKKFQMMISMFNLDIEEITNANYFPSPTLAIVWARAMQAHLNMLEAAGTPVYEEDGKTLMKMGPYVQ